MKAIILALATGVLLCAAVSIRLRFTAPAEPARALFVLYLALLPGLGIAFFLTPGDLGFLNPQFICPSFLIEFAFAMFLYSAGFFGGLLQLYNLADRGLSLRILIDILESPTGSMTISELSASYGGGRGIRWMYEKRLEGLTYAGISYFQDDRMVLTDRGKNAARLFARLQQFARIHGCG